MTYDMIFNKCYFDHRISVKINELNNVQDIQDLLSIKVGIDNKCLN